MSDPPIPSQANDQVNHSYALNHNSHYNKINSNHNDSGNGSGGTVTDRLSGDLAVLDDKHGESSPMSSEDPTWAGLYPRYNSYELENNYNNGIHSKIVGYRFERALIEGVLQGNAGKSANLI